MIRPRIIPVLLLKGQGLVKTRKFKNERYLGDPINAVKIFNDLKADELIFLDILASIEKRTISLDFVKHVGEEADMPFSVGGGITSIEQIRKIINAGAEKVVLNTAAYLNHDLIREASVYFGRSTITVCIDIKRNLFKKPQIYLFSKRKIGRLSPMEYAKLVEKKGAGEVIVQSVDNDGAMKGYDLELLKDISQNLRIPVVSLGGAGNIEDFEMAINHAYCSAVAAGSMFVYHGRRQGILVNYITRKQKRNIYYE